MKKKDGNDIAASFVTLIGTCLSAACVVNNNGGCATTRAILANLLCQLFCQQLEFVGQNHGIYESRHWNIRATSGFGLYAAFLPTLAFISVCSFQEPDWILALCSSLCVQCFVLGYSLQCGLSLITEFILATALPCVLTWLFFSIPLTSVIYIISFSLLNLMLLNILLKQLPLCFSFGEALFTSNGIILCIVGGCTFVQELERHNECFESIFFVLVALVSCVLVLLTHLALPSSRSSFGFYMTLTFVSIGFSIPAMYIGLNSFSVFWLLSFVFHSQRRIFLLVYWIVCSVMSIVIVKQSSSNLQKDEENDEKLKKSLGKKTDKIPKNSRLKINIRKYFHIFAVVVFLPGLIFDREMLAVAATCAIVVFILLEVVRVLHVFPAGEIVDHHFRVLADDRDSGPIIFTHLYLLLGFTTPLWLGASHWTQETGIHPVLLCGILSLGLGDTAASYIGTRFGKHRWPGTSKTIEGSSASIVVQIVFLSILCFTGLVQKFDVILAVISIILTTFLEAFTSQIDNLILPTYMACLFGNI